MTKRDKAVSNTKSASLKAAGKPHRQTEAASSSSVRTAVKVPLAAHKR